MYGIDMPTREELIAASLTNQGIAAEVGADSVAFLALDSLVRATHSQGRCMACFTGNYPIPMSENGIGLITLGI
jgi:amidophosphoribosyltransferase